VQGAVPEGLLGRVRLLERPEVLAQGVVAEPDGIADEAGEGGRVVKNRAEQAKTPVTECRDVSWTCAAWYGERDAGR
jgi:hypothetical protein